MLPYPSRDGALTPPGLDKGHRPTLPPCTMWQGWSPASLAVPLTPS